MNKLRIVLGLIGTFLCVHANALQMGQLTAASRLGEPLSARVELFGVSAGASGSLEVAIKPDIASATGSREQTVIAAMKATVAHAQDGTPYIALHSASPVNEPLVRFRVRVAAQRETRIAHFTLALSPPVAQATPRGRIYQNRPPAALPASFEQSYGPVQPGQSLWQILQQLGLTNGSTTALIQQIVATNPRAFIDGDANRLRVGATLQMPGSARAAATSPARAARRVVLTDALEPQVTAEPDAAVDAGVNEESATTLAIAHDEASAGVPSAAVPTDDIAATEARLAALADKFAAIRARYAEQAKEAMVTAPAVAVSTAAVAPPQPSEVVATPAAVAAAVPEVEVRQAPAQPAETVAAPALARIFLGTGLGALVLLVGTLAVIGYRSRRRRHGERGVGHGDAKLVAEIGRKAEKRLQLEDEIKRMRAAKLAPPSQPASEPAQPGTDDSLVEVGNRIAHGQYADAETMLIDIIRSRPRNFRAKLRLVEIFYLNERAEEFVELASDLYANHRADIGDDGWQRVVRMGKVIAPDRPPFSGPIEIRREA